MNPEEIAKKMKVIARRIKSARGPLELFGLFLREDSLDLWDIVVSAPWLKADERESFEYIASQLRKALTNDELTGLSRIVILEHDSALQRSFLERFKNQTGLKDVCFIVDNGTTIRRAYLVVACPVVEQRRPRRTKKPRNAKSK